MVDVEEKKGREDESARSKIQIIFLLSVRGIKRKEGVAARKGTYLLPDKGPVGSFWWVLKICGFGLCRGSCKPKWQGRGRLPILRLRSVALATISSTRLLSR